MKAITFHFSCNLIWFAKDGRSFRKQAVVAGDTILAKSIQKEPYEPVNSIDFTAKYRLETDDGFYANVFETEKEKIELLPD